MGFNAWAFTPGPFGGARDSSDVDNALLLALQGDATLQDLMPDGVYWDEAPPGSTQFVIVSLVTHRDEPMFQQRAFEDSVYLVKAVARGVSWQESQTKAAASRIDALLDGGTLTIPGYQLMVMQRQDRIRLTEVDEVDPDLRWQHRGGHYQLMVST